MKSPRRNLTALLLLLAASLSPLGAQEDEADQLAILVNPDATFVQKQDACRALARIGTVEAIPALAALLGDAELSHMARLALEPIPEPAVDTALRDALAKVKGRQILGVIGSLGARGDEKAIPALAELLSSDDSDTANAAARAIGNIGTIEAAEALRSRLENDSASPRQIQVICEGLLRCAESLAAAGQTEQARQLYDRMAEIKDAPHQIRTASLRGAVLTRGEGEGLPMLLKALGSEDYATFISAVRIAMELEGATVAGALAGALDNLPAERQVLVIQTLDQRGDPTCAPVLMELVDNGETTVRIAAAQGLTRLVHIPVVPVLATLSFSSDEELATAARKSLASFPDQAADDAIADLLENDDAEARLIGTELISQRNIDLALPTLMKIASSDTDETVRVAALKGLRDVAGLDELDALLDILLETDSTAVIQAATHAVITLCARQPVTAEFEILKATYGNKDNPKAKGTNVTKKVAKLVAAGNTAIEATNATFDDPLPGVPKQLTIRYKADGIEVTKTVPEKETLVLTSPNTSPPVADPLVTALGKATSTPAKIALLRVLERVGGPVARQAIQAAASDADAKIRDTAKHMLRE